MYTAKRGTSVTARYIEARLGKPSLVRETSRISFLEMIKHPYRSFKQLFVQNDDPLKGVVLNVISIILKFLKNLFRLLWTSDYAKLQLQQKIQRIILDFSAMFYFMVPLALARLCLLRYIL